MREGRGEREEERGGQEKKKCMRLVDCLAGDR